MQSYSISAQSSLSDSPFVSLFCATWHNDETTGRRLLYIDVMFAARAVKDHQSIPPLL